jgi:hypothetical protein
MILVVDGDKASDDDRKLESSIFGRGALSFVVDGLAIFLGLIRGVRVDSSLSAPVEIFGRVYGKCSEPNTASSGDRCFIDAVDGIKTNSLSVYGRKSFNEAYGFNPRCDDPYTAVDVRKCAVSVCSESVVIYKCGTVPYLKFFRRLSCFDFSSFRYVSILDLIRWRSSDYRIWVLRLGSCLNRPKLMN